MALRRRIDGDPLSQRERNVLEAVVRTYVETAEPAGSRTLARRYDFGVSAATIRNTMADLEDEGYLTHPHTSAGRVPTDMAYRFFVDRVVQPEALTPTEKNLIEGELHTVTRRSSRSSVAPPAPWGSWSTNSAWVPFPSWTTRTWRKSISSACPRARC